MDGAQERLDGARAEAAQRLAALKALLTAKMGEYQPARLMRPPGLTLPSEAELAAVYAPVQKACRALLDALAYFDADHEAAQAAIDGEVPNFEGDADIVLALRALSRTCFAIRAAREDGGGRSWR